MRTIRTGLIIAVAAILGALSPVSARAADELTIAAASSLQDALDPILHAFEQAHGAKARVTYAGSGQLMAQIEGGAPIDLFLTARVEMFDEPAWKSASPGFGASRRTASC
ncbi:MAG: substrate-binding domain-containing protein [Deltaproteobacteria bacterium]|nr:substrate-binding domain-containing protein [Deltaproteobacteria bacterium]